MLTAKDEASSEPDCDRWSMLINYTENSHFAGHSNKQYGCVFDRDEYCTSDASQINAYNKIHCLMIRVMLA